MDVATHEQPDELLNDTGELDAGDTPVFSGIDADEPVHLAKCLECASAVRFRSNITGTGFFLVDEAPDSTFGVGPNGRPVCPNGHGEMSIADEAIPAADAIAQVADRLNEAKQRTLPGCLPAFNYEAVCREMTNQAVQVQAAKRVYDDDAAKAKASKKRWDEAEELLTNIGLRFAQRINARDNGLEDEPAPAPEVVQCTWEAKSPTLRTCPICRGTVIAGIVERILGIDVPPPDAAAHADSVEALMLALELEELIEALEHVDTYIDRAVVEAWNEDERAAALVWARTTLETNTVIERPAVIAKPHIPAKAIPDEHQVCSLCEEVIHVASDERDAFKETDYVGVGCKGKPATVGHHYPKSSKKKPAAKAKKNSKARR